MDILHDESQLTPAPSRRPRRRSIALVGLGGLMVGFLAAGAVGTAGAQSDGGAVSDDAAEQSSEFDLELSPEDEAVFEKFEACLDEADEKLEAELGTDDVELTPEQEQAFDAAFEGCEPILEDLSEDVSAGFDLELSPEDEAVFEKFEACLDEADEKLEAELGTDDAELTPEQEQAFDAAFEGCEPILEDLSEDASVIMDGDLSCDEDVDGAEGEDLHDGDTEAGATAEEGTGGA